MWIVSSLNVEERDADVAGDYQAFFEHPVQNLERVDVPRGGWCAFHKSLE